MAKLDRNTTQILKKIGQRLRELRKEKGFKSYEQFAFTHEINRVQYGYYEQGIKDLRISSLVKVLNAHDLTLSQFFDEYFDEELKEKS